MGLCSSCRRPNRSQEREPLLPTTTKQQGNAQLESKINNAVNILAALNVGKLPSQDQINRLLQRLLKSNVLSSDSGQAVPGYGPLSVSGRKVVADVRELIEAALQMGMEKNHDDKLQDLLFQSANIDENSVLIDAAVVADTGDEALTGMQAKAAAPPTRKELAADTSNFIHALKRLLRLLLTSAAFRLIISDILLMTREFIAGAAADIGDVAHHVQVGAEQVKEAARLGTMSWEGLKGKANEVEAELKHIGGSAATIGQDVSVAAKDIVIGRIQDIILQAHKNPEYRSALRTILFIFRKYSQKLRTTASAARSATEASSKITIVPIIWTDPHIDHALVDIKILLERAGSGLSLDPLLHTLTATISGTVAAASETGSDLTLYFSSLGQWLDCALSQPAFVTSPHGTRAAESLYDAGRNILASPSESSSQWARDTCSLLDHTDTFISALSSDRSTMRLVRALDALSLDAKTLAHDAAASGIAAQRRRREELAEDVWGWLVPRVLKSLRAIPMPRVEYRDSALDVAVDALLFTAAGPPSEASLAPDRLVVQSWSEFRLETVPEVLRHDGAGPLGEPESSSSARVRVHMDGMRVSARGIGYYVRYKGVIGYADEGLLSVDVGGRSVLGEGVSVDIVLERASSAGTGQQGSEADTKQPLFRVVDVKVAVPGLRFSIDRSKHWILNKVVVQPLAGPIGRWIVGRLVEAQVRTGLEAVERVMSDVVIEAQKKTTARSEAGGDANTAELVADYWGALLEKVASMFSHGEDSDLEAIPAEGSSTPSPMAESHTTVGLTGVVRTTLSQPSNGTAEPSETVLAIGGGAQLFPGKGGPYDEDGGVDAVEQAGRDVGEAVVGVVGRVQDAVGEVADGAVGARENLQRVQVRARESEERERRGWRSQVFEF